MSAIWAVTPAWVKMLAAVGVALAVGYFSGHIQGVRSGKLTQMRDTVKALETRSDVDAETKSLPDYDKCLKLGGLPDTCAELRRMDRAAEGK